MPVSTNDRLKTGSGTSLVMVIDEELINLGPKTEIELGLRHYRQQW